MEQQNGGKIYTVSIIKMETTKKKKLVWGKENPLEYSVEIMVYPF